MKKEFYFDVETTGLDPSKHHIVQLAGMVKIEGKMVEQFNFLMRPIDFRDISPQALSIQGRTLDEIEGYPPSNDAYKELLYIFDKYIDKYDKDDKFVVMGYNVDFDINFLNNFFRFFGNNFLFSYLGAKIDPLPVVRFLSLTGKLPNDDIERFDLGSVCKYFGIHLNAHDAMSDIIATEELVGVLSKGVFYAGGN